MVVFSTMEMKCSSSSGMTRLLILGMMGAEIPFTEREPERLTCQHPK